MVLDFRRQNNGSHNPISIDGEAVEEVQTLHLCCDLAWSTNTKAMANKSSFLPEVPEEGPTPATAANQLLLVYHIITYCIISWTI